MADMNLITSDELANLRFQSGTSSLKSQIVTSSCWGGARTAPYAFTEHGGKREQGRYIFDAESNSNLTPLIVLLERRISPKLH